MKLQELIISEMAVEQWKGEVKKLYGKDVADIEFNEIDSSEDADVKNDTEDGKFGINSKTPGPKVVARSGKGKIVLGVYYKKKGVGHVYIPKPHFESKETK